MAKDTNYYSDWIENTGTMPVGITNETVLKIKYTDGHCTNATSDWYFKDYWVIRDDEYDIDMYRYVYDTVAVAHEENQNDR